MGIFSYTYWFDRQQIRFLEQIISAFSGFSYQPGLRQGMPQPPRLVPCRMATRDMMVGYLMRNLSENSLNAVPLITVSQTGLVGKRDRVQDLMLVEKINVQERQVENGQYTGLPGNTYTVHRMMPRPFELHFQVDIWTSNQMQKHQLLEQILPVVYPFFDIQNSTNAVDWTALTTVYIDDDIIYSSKSIPVGTAGNEIDVTTITGNLPIWLSPPAKVTNQKLIREVITNIYDGGTVDDCGALPGGFMTRVIVTPEDANISVDGDTITLLNSKGGFEDSNGNLMNFANYLGQFGTYENGVSTISITSQFGGPYVIGTVTTDTNNVNRLFWQIDPTTLPANTLPAINNVIDPLRNVPYPNDGATLPLPVEGVRYLLTNDIIPSTIWPNLKAYTNDIIQFTNGAWVVVFSARSIKTQQYLVNQDTLNQLFWSGEQWMFAIDGTYAPGYWTAQVSNTEVTSFQVTLNEQGNASDSNTN